MIEPFLESVSTNGLLVIIALAIICGSAILFFWIICRSASEAIKQFRLLIQNVIRMLPREFQNPPGRVNIFIIILTFLLVVISLLTQTPVDIIEMVMRVENQSQYIPCIFLLANIIVDILSPLMVFKWILITEENVE